MTITLSEAKTALCKGTSLVWKGSGGYKAGDIQMADAGQRRLAKYLLEADQALVASGDESLFDEIVEVWKDEGNDPSDDAVEIGAEEKTGPWRLAHVEAEGFGGLNTPGGPKFELDVGGENWCVEGYNGAGKTSLASLVLWTMTGLRNREQFGPLADNGIREAVTDSSGKKVGTWPPLVTYPDSIAELKKDATALAKLTFVDPAGNTAQAARSVTSPVVGGPVDTKNIDPRLRQSPELLEAGLIMPARIAHIGFGKKSQTLYEALKMLTGLDHLTSLASGATALGHGSKKFRKYAKDAGADALALRFRNEIDKAKELAAAVKLTVPVEINIDEEKILETLQSVVTEASSQAGEALDVLKTEITDTLDLKNSKDRDELTRAVNKARVYLGERTSGVPLFKAWAALKAAGDQGFDDMAEPLKQAEDALAEALSWHGKQQADGKFRLKALAASFFIDQVDIETAASCPLCETDLKSEDQKILAAELKTLKSDANRAERAIADACRDIKAELAKHVPKALIPHIQNLANMIPANAFGEAMKARFSDDEPFSNILSGIAAFVQSHSDQMAAKLPVYSIESNPVASSEIAEVQNLREHLQTLDNVSKLTKFWADNRSAFVDGWKTLIGVQDDDGNWPDASFEGKLEKLENAITSSEPLDKIAKAMSDAKEAAKKWNEINEVQRVRDEIVIAIEPLKDLQKLVDCETHRTIEILSGRVSGILADIRLRDRFSFQNTAMSKKSVTVEGSFADGLKIDAALVANSSWLRALMWAFIFALREQTIADLGHNPFPLMVLDDPQTTFDPRNKKKWAEKIVSIACLQETDKDGMQLFLTTHERQFHDMVCASQKFDCQQGEISGPCSSTGVAHIVNGTFLGRTFDDARATKNDRKGYAYIQMMRVYCEDLLRIMLRPESYELNGNTMGPLRDLIRNRRTDHVHPFNRSVFLKLINLLDAKNDQRMEVINESHHTFDGTVGFTQAEDVEKFWRKSLQPAFLRAFRLAADYDAYGGVTRLFTWEENVVALPEGNSVALKELIITSTGVAAAATSDGRIGDGQIAIDNWAEEKTVSLFKHSAYHLNADTLEPVASIGDVILVQDFGEPQSSNLIVAAFGDKLYARRLNETEDHPEIILLTGQATHPTDLPEPVIAPKDKTEIRKIVGTIFMPLKMGLPVQDENEVSVIVNIAKFEAHLKGVKLFEVDGQSMEPVALAGQYVMTREESMNNETLKRLSGELVIAGDSSGGIYFKRLRKHNDLVVLESANSSVNTSSEILCLGADGIYPQITMLKSVVGVLFDLPNAG